MKMFITASLIRLLNHPHPASHVQFKEVTKSKMTKAIQSSGPARSHSMRKGSKHSQGKLWRQVKNEKGVGVLLSIEVPNILENDAST